MDIGPNLKEVLDTGLLVIVVFIVWYFMTKD